MNKNGSTNLLRHISTRTLTFWGCSDSSTKSIRIFRWPQPYILSIYLSIKIKPSIIWEESCVKDILESLLTYSIGKICLLGHDWNGQFWIFINTIPNGLENILKSLYSNTNWRYTLWRSAMHSGIEYYFRRIGHKRSVRINVISHYMEVAKVLNLPSMACCIRK